MQQEKRNYFISVLPRLLILIPFLLCQPQTVQAAERRALVPVGQTVGVTMDTKGLLVLGTGVVDGEADRSCAPCKGILKAGDLVLEADGQPMENKEAFLEAVENSNGKVMTLLLKRDGKEKEVKITPAFSAADNAYKIGAWIRDSIQGIGTVTYYDPYHATFGALGHGVYDVDTGELMEIREGSLVSAEMTEIAKGQKGVAGELVGKVDLEDKIARIEGNTEVGIYGKTDSTVFDGKALPVAQIKEVKKGEAFLLSDLEGGKVEEYRIQIESVDRDGAKDNKDMTICITDERLLGLTGGIVQGMSGSPIIQDGKIIGAVTFVMLNDPSKGYAIFIGNMLSDQIS